MKINSSIMVFAVILILFLPSHSFATSEYFGYDTQGGSTTTMSPSYCWGNKYSGDFYTASGNEVIDTLIIWCNPQNNNNKIVFALYTISAGAIRYKSLVSDTLTLSGSGVSRWVRPANLTLAAERQYSICIDVIGSTGPSVCYTSQSNGLSRTNNATFPDTWSDDVNNNMRYCIAAHISSAKQVNLSRRRGLMEGEK